MKNWLRLGMAAVALTTVQAWAIDYCDQEVQIITPGKPVSGGMAPPSDAIVLFDGHDLLQWKGRDGEPPTWDVKDGIATVRKGSGDIETRESFRDLQLHLEWRIPVGITGEGQHRGNSGVFLMGRYEIQILDSYHNRTYANGQAGAVFGQVAPLVNAMRPPGEWNTYDIVFTAPRFYDDGRILTPARVTVLHNGVLIQNNADVLGSTGAWGRPGYYEAQERGAIRLQDHPGPDKPVSFRNIWVRELGAGARGANSASAQDLQHPLKVVSTKTIGELLEDPGSREVLMRCVPELVPNPKVLDYVDKKTLEQLKGELDIALTDEKLRIIEAELARALADTADKSKP